MTTPLTVWTCDACRDDITDPTNAFVIFNYDDQERAVDFHIVHHNNYGKRCDPPAMPGSIELSHLLGPDGLAQLLSFLSPGPIKGGSGATVGDLNGFVDLVRRVQTPWYEQARDFWTTDKTQEHFGDNNEYRPYVPEHLERIAKQDLD